MNEDGEYSLASRDMSVDMTFKEGFYSGFIQARLCKFKDFSKTFLLFSRTENLRKILIYMLKFYFRNARVHY